jgi:hypothetical protein
MASEFCDTFEMRHLGQGKDIARSEFVPDIPRVRGAEVLFLVDLGCREGAPVWSARHGISGSILLLRWMIGRCLRWWLMRARELGSGETKGTRCHVFINLVSRAGGGAGR